MRYLLVVLLLTSLFLVITVNASLSLETIGNIYIADPRYSVPMPLKPGSIFNITVRVGSAKVDEILMAEIVGLNTTYKLSTKPLGHIGEYYIVQAVLPKGVRSGLYDLILKLLINGKEVILRSPRSVWIITKDPETLTIVQMGDSIIGSFYAGRTATEMYTQAVFYANALNADLAVIVGDDIDVGNEVNALIDFNKVTNQLRIPSFIIPGNHDWAQVKTVKEFVNLYYGKYVGPRYWYRVVGKFIFIGLDGGYENYLDDTQLRWLDNVLNKHQDKAAVIIIHPPIIINPGNYTFRNADELLNKYPKDVHKSWATHKDSLSKFIDILNKYKNIIAILAGDTHKDEVALINNRIWLITVTAIGHPNVYKYRGFRVIRLHANGSLEFPIVPKSKNPYGTEASINTDYSYVREYHDSKYTMFAYSIETSPKFDLTIVNATLYFYVNSSIDLSKYKFYGNTSLIKDVKRYYYGDYIVFKVIADIRPGMNYTLVLSSYKDKTPPVVSVRPFITRPIAGKQWVPITISVKDEGWGVRDVWVLYKAKGETLWHRIRASRSGIMFVASIPPLNVTELIVKAEAEDLAGHIAESKEVVLKYVVPKPTKTTRKVTTTTLATPITTTMKVTTTKQVRTTARTVKGTTIKPTIRTTPKAIKTTALTTTTTKTESTTTQTTTTTLTLTTAITTTAVLTTPLGFIVGIVAFIAIIVAIVLAIILFLRRR